MPAGGVGAESSRTEPMEPMDLIADLEARGLIHDATDLDALRARLAAGPIGVYCGFDPTADSLHVGHLLGQLTLRRFQLADRLARIYIQYMAYRPDWLEDWSYSRNTFDGAGFHPVLWRLLRQALDEPHRGERLADLGAALRAGGVDVGATDPLHVFGISHLAPAELAFSGFVSPVFLLVLGVFLLSALLIESPWMARWSQALLRRTQGSPRRRFAALVLSAVALTMAGRTAAVVTNPIAKAVLYDAGFGFPGHTEFLADLAAKATGEEALLPVMLLAGPKLRAVPVTIHIPLKDVPEALTEDLIVETAVITERDLRQRFGITRPRLAIAGLNPHAGEGGALGLEDDAVVRPAVERLKATGIAAVGPLPADTMFHEAARATYDVALCMYHDQALIPAKALGFDDSVNATLGLPFIRTSPDHGTAFAIAGKGIAKPDSLLAALRLAQELAMHAAKETL